jgi:hypothetical protein
VILGKLTMRLYALADFSFMLVVKERNGELKPNFPSAFTDWEFNHSPRRSHRPVRKSPTLADTAGD